MIEIMRIYPAAKRQKNAISCARLFTAESMSVYVYSGRRMAAARDKHSKNKQPLCRQKPLGSCGPHHFETSHLLFLEGLEQGKGSRFTLLTSLHTNCS